MESVIQVVGMRGSDHYCPWCSSDTNAVANGPYCNKTCKEKLYHSVRQKFEYVDQRPTLAAVSNMVIGRPPKMLRASEKSVVEELVERLQVA